ncbi:MAG: heme exporter protein CcmD [Pseudomonadota bacterium]
MMIVDLGPHALPVLGAYGVSAVLIGALIAVTLIAARRARAALTAAEGDADER